MNNKILKLGFFHIPKTAGVYIAEAVSRYYGIQNIPIHGLNPSKHKEIGIQKLTHETDSNLIIFRERVFYSGHFSFDECTMLDRNYLFTLISDPYQRAFALYRYGLAIKQNLPPFLEWLESNFKGSILKQFYASEHNFSKDSKINIDTFVELINYIEVSNDPDDCIKGLNARLGLQIDSLGELLNTAAEFNLNSRDKESISASKVLDALASAVEVDLAIIDVVRNNYPNQVKIEKFKSDIDSVHNLAVKYGFLRIV